MVAGNGNSGFLINGKVAGNHNSGTGINAITLGSSNQATLTNGAKRGESRPRLRKETRKNGRKIYLQILKFLGYLYANIMISKFHLSLEVSEDESYKEIAKLTHKSIRAISAITIIKTHLKRGTMQQ